MLQVINLVSLIDKDVIDIAGKHALKVAANQSMWTDMDRFYLKATIE